MYASASQISYITHLSTKKGFSSVIAACEEYGFGLRAARDLTKYEASEMIEWLNKAALTADQEKFAQTKVDEFEARCAVYRAQNAALV